jgi:hypothetical protein
LLLWGLLSRELSDAPVGSARVQAALDQTFLLVQAALDDEQLETYNSAFLTSIRELSRRLPRERQELLTRALQSLASHPRMPSGITSTWSPPASNPALLLSGSWMPVDREASLDDEVPPDDEPDEDAALLSMLEAVRDPEVASAPPHAVDPSPSPLTFEPSWRIRPTGSFSAPEVSEQTPDPDAGPPSSEPEMPVVGASRPAAGASPSLELPVFMDGDDDDDQGGALGLPPGPGWPAREEARGVVAPMTPPSLPSVPPASAQGAADRFKKTELILDPDELLKVPKSAAARRIEELRAKEAAKPLPEAAPPATPGPQPALPPLGGAPSPLVALLRPPPVAPVVSALPPAPVISALPPAPVAPAPLAASVTPTPLVPPLGGSPSASGAQRVTPSGKPAIPEEERSLLEKLRRPVSVESVKSLLGQDLAALWRKRREG